MAYLNDNYLKLQAGYLFPEIARRVREFCEANPDAARRVIRCGIGDVTEPLPPAVIAAMHRAVDELNDHQLEAVRSVLPRPVAGSVDDLEVPDALGQGANDLLGGGDRRDGIELAERDECRSVVRG